MQSRLFDLSKHLLFEYSRQIEAKELCKQNIFSVSSWESTANQVGQLLTQLSSNQKKGPEDWATELFRSGLSARIWIAQNNYSDPDFGLPGIVLFKFCHTCKYLWIPDLEVQS